MFLLTLSYGYIGPARTTDYLAAFIRVGNLDNVYRGGFDYYSDITIRGCERVVVDPVGDVHALFEAAKNSEQEFTASVIWYYTFSDMCYTPVYRMEYLRCSGASYFDGCYTTSPHMWAREMYVTATETGSRTGLELYGFTKDLSGVYMLVVRVAASIVTALVNIEIVEDCPKALDNITPSFRANCWRGDRYENGFNGDALHPFNIESRHEKYVQENFRRKLSIWASQKTHRTPQAPPAPHNTPPTKVFRTEATIIQITKKDSDHKGDENSWRDDVYYDSEPERSPTLPSRILELNTNQVILKPDNGGYDPNWENNTPVIEEKQTFSFKALILVGLSVAVLTALIFCATRCCCCRGPDYSQGRRASI